jgi:hypothetical protein
MENKKSYLAYVADRMRAVKDTVSVVAKTGLVTGAIGGVAAVAGAFGIIPPEIGPVDVVASGAAVATLGLFDVPFGALIIGGEKLDTLKELQKYERADAAKTSLKRQHPRVQKNLRAVLEHNSPKPIYYDIDA